jgi:nucleoside phosphorylase
VQTRAARLLAVAGLLAALATIPSTASAAPTAPTAPTAAACRTHRVLLLGSYPGEVSANLAREHLASHQPTVAAGHDFYVGRLAGHRVVLGIAGPSPAVARSTTALALRTFRCVNAVVFTGTAGGGGRSQLGDVTVPRRWTGNEGKTFDTVNARAMTVARSISAAAGRELSKRAAIDDGPCACSGLVHRLTVVPTLRTSRMVIGGKGISFGGQGDTCSAQGGQLAGCNPCPPSTKPAPTLTSSSVGRDASGPKAAAHAAALAMKRGILAKHPHRLLSWHAAPRPPSLLATPDDGSTTAATDYIADDQQTFASMAAAEAAGVAFIAFRGISDTASVGDLWPFEYLVYQQLAADNAATAARLWLGAWRT